MVNLGHIEYAENYQYMDYILRKTKDETNKVVAEMACLMYREKIEKIIKSWTYDQAGLNKFMALYKYLKTIEGVK